MGTSIQLRAFLSELKLKFWTGFCWLTWNGTVTVSHVLSALQFLQAKVLPPLRNNAEVYHFEKQAKSSHRLTSMSVWHAVKIPHWGERGLQAGVLMASLNRIRASNFSAERDEIIDFWAPQVPLPLSFSRHPVGHILQCRGMNRNGATPKHLMI